LSKESRLLFKKVSDYQLYKEYSAPWSEYKIKKNGALSDQLDITELNCRNPIRVPSQKILSGP
jgi:hypothetical protein